MDRIAQAIGSRNRREMATKYRSWLHSQESLPFQGGEDVNMMVHKSFRLVYWLPEGLTKWIGGTGGQMGESGDTEEARRTIIAGGAYTTQNTMQQTGSKATAGYKQRDHMERQANMQNQGQQGGQSGGSESDYSTGQSGGGEGSDSKET